MKALILEKNGKIKYGQNETLRKKSASETLLKVVSAGICSSDIPRAFQHGSYSYPLILGHEIFGEIVSSGTKENVVVYPLIACRKCKSCMGGFFNLCKNYDYIGSRRDGGFAEYVSVPKENFIKIPKTISPIVCAITEPTAVVVHAARQAQDLKDKKVLIIGDGSMGLILSRFLTHCGCTSVYVCGKYAHKLKIAKSFGAAILKTGEESLGREKFKSFFDVVFELAGTNSAYVSAISAVKPHGEIFFIGNIHDDLRLPRNLFSQILRKEVLIKGCWNSLPNDWSTALDFLRGAPDIKKVVSHTFALKDGASAMRAIYRRELKDYIKAVFCV